MQDFSATRMSRDELEAFLVEGLRFAALASLRKDGSPFVVPVGFVYDGRYLYFTISPEQSGVKRMRRDPRVCVTVFNDSMPVKFAVIAGEVEEIADPDHAVSLAIFNRAPMPGIDVEKFLEGWLADGRVVFRLEVREYASEDLTKAALPVEPRSADDRRGP